MEQVQLSHRANTSPHFRLPVLIKYSGNTLPGITITRYLDGGKLPG